MCSIETWKVSIYLFTKFTNGGSVDLKSHSLPHQKKKIISGSGDALMHLLSPILERKPYINNLVDA